MFKKLISKIKTNKKTEEGTKEELEENSKNQTNSTSENEEDSSNFQDFTPKDDLALNKNLKEAFDFAFNNKKINNIGLLGKYAAGKSSLINSYLKTRKDIKFIKISFAHFKDCETKDNTSKDKEKDNKDESQPIDSLALERKIINQLLNLIDSNKIKLTSFYVKRDFKNIRFIFKSIFLSFYIICWIILLGVIKNIDLLKNHFIITFSGFYIFIGTFFYVYKLMIFIINGHKIKFNTLDLEIKKHNDKIESYFDLYLNEIIYLLENSQCNVILFEDMDRFEIKPIFERLHEINGVVNQRLKKKDKSIKFVYLARENIFTNEDTSKFFDFIIPTPSILNRGNSYTMLLNLFGNDIDKYEFNYDTLKKLSTYISDVRMLKRIYNEFLIYYDIVNSFYRGTNFKVDANKIFLIALYKTFFPRDFNNFQQNEGVLYNLLFKADSKIINNMLSPYKSILEKKYKDQIERVKNKDLFDEKFNIDEYIDYCIMYDNYEYLDFNEYIWNLYDAYSILKYNQMISGYIYIYNKEHITKHKTDYSEIGVIDCEEISNVLIEKKLIIYIESISTQIKNSGYFSYEILYTTIFKIYEKFKDDIEILNPDNFFDDLMENVFENRNIDFSNIEFMKNKELFLELLKSGYLDNSILDYTSFPNDNINLNKELFISKVKYNPDYKKNTDIFIDQFNIEINPKQTVSEIESIYWFNNLNILNFDLLDYLLFGEKDKKSNTNLLFIKLDAFILNLNVSISVLENENEVKFLFIFKYFLHIENKEKRNKFIDSLVNNNIKIYELDIHNKNIIKTLNRYPLKKK